MAGDDQKRAEIISDVEADLERRGLLQIDSAQLATAVDRFCTIEPPEVDRAFHSILLSGPQGLGGGKSRKPGNITLNWKTLLLEAAGAVPSVAGAASSDSPWMAALAALSIWNKIWARVSVDLSERQAIVMCALWRNTDKGNYVSAEGLPQLVDEKLTTLSRPTMTDGELDAVLDDLQKLRCIEKDENRWWLREWARTS